MPLRSQRRRRRDSAPPTWSDSSGCWFIRSTSHEFFLLSHTAPCCESYPRFATRVLWTLHVSPAWFPSTGSQSYIPVRRCTSAPWRLRWVVTGRRSRRLCVFLRLFLGWTLFPVAGVCLLFRGELGVFRLGPGVFFQIIGPAPSLITFCSDKWLWTRSEYVLTFPTPGRETFSQHFVSLRLQSSTGVLRLESVISTIRNVGPV